MVSIAPNPQQPMAQMPPPPAGSPVSAHPQYSGQPNGPPPYGHGYSMSFDSPQHAVHSQPSYAHSFSASQSFPNGPVSGAGYSRSFGDGYGAGTPQPQRVYDGKPQIYTVCLKVCDCADLDSCVCTLGRLLRCLGLRNGCWWHRCHEKAV